LLVHAILIFLLAVVAVDSVSAVPAKNQILAYPLILAILPLFQMDNFAVPLPQSLALPQKLQILATRTSVTPTQPVPPKENVLLIRPLIAVPPAILNASLVHVTPPLDSVSLNPLVAHPNKNAALPTLQLAMMATSAQLTTVPPLVHAHGPTLTAPHKDSSLTNVPKLDANLPMVATETIFLT